MSEKIGMIIIVVFIIVIMTTMTCKSISYFKQNKKNKPKKSSKPSKTPNSIKQVPNMALDFINTLKEKVNKIYKRIEKKYDTLIKKNAVKLFNSAALNDIKLRNKITLSDAGKKVIINSTKKIIEDSVKKYVEKALPGKFSHIPSMKSGYVMLVFKIALDSSIGKDITTPAYAMELARSIMVGAGVAAAGFVGWPAFLIATGITITADLAVDVFGPYVARKLVEAAIRDAQDLAKTIDVRIRDKSGNVTAIGLPGQGGWVTDAEMDYGKKDTIQEKTQDLTKTFDVRIRDESGNVTAIGLPGQGGLVTDAEMDYGKKEYTPKALVKGPWMGPTIRRWRK